MTQQTSTAKQYVFSLLHYASQSNCFIPSLDPSAVLPWNSSAITVAGLVSGGYYSNLLLGPYGFILDQFNTLYVAEYSANRIVKCVPGAVSGTIIAGSDIGTSANTSRDFNHPFDIVLNSGQAVHPRSSFKLLFQAESFAIHQKR